MKPGILLATCAAVALSTGAALAQEELKMPSWMWDEGSVGEWFDGVVAEYEADSGTAVQKTKLSAADYERQVTTQIAGGAVPDLMPVFTNMLAPMIDAQILAPLDECIAAGGFGDRLLPSVDFAKADGATYGVPLTMSPWSMVVNTALLEEAGVAVPTTVEELYEVSKAVKEKTGAYGYAFGNDMAAPIHVYINAMQWVLGFGSDWSQPDGTITANAPENIEAVTWIKRYMDEGLSPVGLGVAPARDLFVDGKVAIMFEGPWLMAQAGDAGPEFADGVTFEVMPTPTHAAITGGAFYAIPKDAENPEAACALLTEFMSEDAQRGWLEGTTQIPGTNVQPGEEFLAENGWVANMAEIAAKYPGGLGYAPPGYSVQAAEFRQMVVDALSEIYSGKTSVEDGLNDLQKRLEMWSAML